MITLIAKFFAAINANSRPGEIGAGFACGVMLALIPFGNLLWFLLFIVFFLLRLHAGTMLLVTAVLKFFIGFTDPLLDTIGLWFLTHPSLYDAFTALYNTPFIPLTRFYNSLVTGGLLFGAVIWLPLFFLGKIAVVGYRNTVRDKIAESKLVKSIGRYPAVAKISAALRKVSGVYKSWSS